MSEDAIFAECFFLDVGQGTSQVILLRNGGAILIDAGPGGPNRNRRSVPLKLLDRFLTGEIEAFIISHNDADHDGGASRVFAAYSNRIKRVFFLLDRPLHDIYFYRLLLEQQRRDRFTGEIARLEASCQPHVLFRDDSCNIALELIAPTFLDALGAEAGPQADRPNRTSAVLALNCGNRRLVFAGDATMEAFREISSRASGPIICDVVAVPHHGGRLSGDADSKYGQECQWLYREALRARHAVISVGSSNNYGHPSPLVVSALKNCGTTVLCTQITPQCCDDLERLRPGLIAPQFPSQSMKERDTSGANRSKNVGCYGTVITEIGLSAVHVRRVPEHQSFIDSRLSLSDFHPLCRQTFPQGSGDS